MTHPGTTDPAADESSSRAQEALTSDEGVGATTTDEPDTFEPEEPTRFGRLSRRLWSGLLSVEELAEG